MSRPLYRIVFFGVETTLLASEGIEELAADHPELARLTAAATRGDIPVEAFYREIDLLRPPIAAVAALAAKYCASVVSGAAATITALREAAVDVHLVTGGIAQAVLPLADLFGLAPRAVHAVSLEFDAAGNYSGFDRRSMLARTGGIELLVRSLLARSKGRSAYVGNGVADLEARGVVDRFVGFGGVRPGAGVRENVDIDVTEPSLTAILPYLLEA